MPMITKAELEDLRARASGAPAVAGEGVNLGVIAERLAALEAKNSVIEAENAILRKQMGAIHSGDEGPQFEFITRARAEVEAYLDSPNVMWNFYCIESSYYSMQIFSDAKTAQISPIDNQPIRRQLLFMDFERWYGAGSELPGRPQLDGKPKRDDPWLNLGVWDPTREDLKPLIRVTRDDVKKFAPHMLKDRDALERVISEHGYYPLEETIRVIAGTNYYRQGKIVSEDRFKIFLRSKYQRIWDEERARRELDAQLGRMEKGAEKTGVLAALLREDDEPQEATGTE